MEERSSVHDCPAEPGESAEHDQVRQEHAGSRQGAGEIGEGVERYLATISSAAASAAATTASATKLARPSASVICTRTISSPANSSTVCTAMARSNCWASAPSQPASN